jgi:hypothetical protein
MLNYNNKDTKFLKNDMNKLYRIKNYEKAFVIFLLGGPASGKLVYIRTVVHTSTENQRVTPYFFQKKFVQIRAPGFEICTFVQSCTFVQNSCALNSLILKRFAYFRTNVLFFST